MELESDRESTVGDMGKEGALENDGGGKLGAAEDASIEESAKSPPRANPDNTG